MSVTLISSPGLCRPAYNPIQWIFSSDNVAECDFEYVVDLLINGVFATRFSSLPTGNDYYGYFDIQATIRNYLSQNPRLAPDGWFVDDKCVVSYQLLVYERFNTNIDCSGSSWLSSIQYTGDISYAFNAALQYHEYKAFTQTMFVAENKQSKFLTDMPSRALIPLDASFSIGFIQAADGITDQVQYLSLNTFDANHVFIANYKYTNPEYTTTNYSLSVGVGPADLNVAIFDGSPIPLPPIDSSVYFYGISLFNSSDEQISETKEFQIDRRCTIYPRHRIWWKNLKGKFDSYTFNLRSMRGMTVTKNTFQKLLDVDYSLGDRGETVIDVNAIERFTFNSNWLTESEDQWIKQLLLTSEAYVQYDDSKRERRNLLGAFCNLPPVYDITAVQHQPDNTAAFFITEITPGSLPNGTVFDYSVTDGSPIGMPSSGTGMLITGYDLGGSFYYTDVVSTISAGAIITGTLTPQGGVSSVAFTVDAGDLIPNGTIFEYKIDDGSSIGMLDSGTGVILSYDAINDVYNTSVSCTIEAGAIFTGFISFKLVDIKIIPIIITTSTFEDKKILDAVNIQRTIEAKPSYKVNTNP